MTIFVFGSNREGRHGKGAALHAKIHYGAIDGRAEGRQGDSYAIITKELRKHLPHVSIAEIKNGVDRFLRYAELHPELTFQVTPIGCGLAGYTHKQIAPLFRDAPSNVELPPEFAMIGATR